MKRIALFALAVAAIVPAWAATNVGVSVGINQPGVYGRIDIGNFPPPVLVYPQPIVIAPTPVAVHQRPIYMHVPPGHQKDWRRYCGHYGACGQPVYFVQESWVREHHHHRADGRDRNRDRDHDSHGRDKQKHKKHGKDKHGD